MAFTITSNGSQEELERDMAAIGLQVENSKPAEKPAEQAATPGEETPAAEAGSEVATETAPVEKKTQKEAQTPAGEEPQKKRGGDFKSKAEKAQALVERLQQDLELEQGSKKKLESQLAEAQAALSKLQPAEAKPKPEEGPVKPKRPTVADFEYDDDKFQAALTHYEDEALPAYYQALNKKQLDDALAAHETKRQEERQQEQAKLEYAKFEARRDAVAKELPDYDEVIGAIPDADIEYTNGQGQTFEHYIQHTATSPADLLYYFGKDTIDNESAELKRFMALPDGYAIVRELGILEDRLIRERTGKAPTKVAAKAPAVETKAPAKASEAPPARPRQAAADPIEPVGTRTATPQDTLAAAAARGDSKAFRALRDQGVNR